MKKATYVTLFMLAAAASMLPSKMAMADGALCLANGAVVTGDTSGLDVQPCPEPATMDPLVVADTSADPVPDPPPSGRMSTLYWGYSAAFCNSALIARRATAPDDPLVACCVPSGPDIPTTSNGRGVAFDPLDGNLWISRLTFFTGDSRITKVSPPTGTCDQTTTCAPFVQNSTCPTVPSGICPEITSLLVHYSGGVPPEQPDFGALDIDQGSKHIWAAGGLPVNISGTLRNYFYLVNRNNGLIIQSCYLVTPMRTPPGGPPFESNDSLTYANLPGLPGSGKYLITDNGGFTSADPLLVIDTQSCKNGQQVTPVSSFLHPNGMTGIDFEWLGLLNTDGPGAMAFNNGDKPFTTATPLGPTTPPCMGYEDISVCGFRAKFGGDDNDGCPYP